MVSTYWAGASAARRPVCPRAEELRDMSRIPPFFAAISLVGSVLLTGATVSYYDASLPSTMNPLFARSIVDYRPHELVFDRLFSRSPSNNELRSRLVARYEKLEGGQKLRRHLVEGIKWHDGERVLPEDVCFTVDA